MPLQGQFPTLYIPNVGLYPVHPALAEGVNVYQMEHMKLQAEAALGLQHIDTMDTAVGETVVALEQSLGAIEAALSTAAVVARPQRYIIQNIIRRPFILADEVETQTEGATESTAEVATQSTVQVAEVATGTDDILPTPQVVDARYNALDRENARQSAEIARLQAELQKASGLKAEVKAVTKKWEAAKAAAAQKEAELTAEIEHQRELRTKQVSTVTGEIADLRRKLQEITKKAEADAKSAKRDIGNLQKAVEKAEADNVRALGEAAGPEIVKRISAAQHRIDGENEQLKLINTLLTTQNEHLSGKLYSLARQALDSYERKSPQTVVMATTARRMTHEGKELFLTQNLSENPSIQRFNVDAVCVLLDALDCAQTVIPRLSSQ
jgi:hypothetical protein